MRAKTLIMAAAVLSMAAGIAWAGDNLQVTVAGGSPTPTQKVNGNQAIQGTIQLWYTVNSFTFPVGNFGSFSVDIQDAHLSATRGQRVRRNQASICQRSQRCWTMQS